MKKITLFIFSLIVGLVIFCGLSVKADPITLTMENGAQIRTAGEFQGLRFQASASSLDGTDEHGFYLAAGEHTLDAMRTAIEAGEATVGGRKLVKRSSTGEDLEFAVTVYGMDEASEYAQVITAIAYIKTGASFTFDKAVTRNIAEKAREMYNASDDPATIVTTVAEATKVKVTHSDSSVNYYGSLAAAITATFAAGDIVNLVKGTYSDALTISVDGVQLVGPYADVKATAIREREALLSGVITTNGNNITINGIGLTGSSGITWTTDISNLTIKNISSNSAASITGKSGTRYGVIASVADNDIEDLVVLNSYITIPCEGTKNAIAIYGKVDGFTMEDCTLVTSGNKSGQYSEAIRYETTAGEISIKNNAFLWVTDNFALYFGGTANTCTKVDIANNIISGTASNTTTTVSVRKAPAGCAVKIVGNHFDYFDAGATVQFNSGVSGSTALIAYNYFSNCSFKEGAIGSTAVTYTNNFYTAAPTAGASDYGDIETLEDLIAAYKTGAGKTLFDAYGGKCVYEG